MVELPKKPETPWAKQKAYCKPDTSVENHTIYNCR